MVSNLYETKLDSYGVGGTFHGWIKDQVSTRKITVRADNEFSWKAKISGAILGLALITVRMNDQPVCTQRTFKVVTNLSVLKGLSKSNLQRA